MAKNLIGIYIALLALSIITTTNAQTYYFDTYGAVEGASSKIYCLLQDNSQNIWLGTPAGVSKFDGNSFESFTNEDGLSPQAVRCVFQDNNNNLWFGHAGGGISVLRDKQFKPFNKIDSLVRGNITSIFQDHDYNIWVTTESSGAYVLANPFNDATFQFRHYMGNNNLSDRVYNYCETPDSSIYLITDVGIRKYINKTESFEVYRPKGLTNYFSIITMFEDASNNLWFGTYNGGLYKYVPTQDTVFVFDKRDGLSSNWISKIIQDRNGNIWVGTWGGGITRITGSSITSFSMKNGLEAEYIFTMIEDNEGNILIGSTNKGLAIYKGDVFINYGKKNGLLNTEVNTIAADKNKNFWIGTNGGIYVFDSTFNELLTRYDKESFLNGNTKSFIAGRIKFIKKDNNNNLWLGTQDQRTMFFNSETDQFQIALDVNKWFTGSDFQVSALDIDPSNRLWVGTYDGLIRYDIELGNSARLSNANGLIGNNISSIYCDHLNQTWIGAYVMDGISKITNGNTIETIRIGQDITPSCMVMDRDSVLWLGTQGQGIFKIKHDTVIGRLNQNNGLNSNLINTLEADDEDNIYIGTNIGLNIIDRQHKRLNSYGIKNGFIGVETNPTASFKDYIGNIWLGTNMGINKFSPKNLKNQIPEPKVHLTHMIVNQEEVPFTTNMRLKHKENHIRFEYKSICLTNPDAVRYLVMLTGVDDNWQDITDQTRITYQTLPPNKYLFKVKARNSAGEWNKEPASYSFQILPPLYQRWYFILSIIVLSILLIRLYILIRTRKLLHEKKLLEGKVKERTVELSVANTELGMKNKDITDSIKYAKRIQMAILPPKIPFDDVFVLFKPKDIVSGDFYWLAKTNNKELLAAVDCTGHGVPGAFISFVGYSSLNKVVKENGNTQPAEILDKLNEAVVTALNLKGEEAIRDGMDLALIAYDPATKVLEYAGAYNPLYLIRNNELLETKADRFAIGKSTEASKKFTNHTITIESGDVVYVFSDGYADQFGGEENKKFKTGQLKKLLVSICNKSIPEQKQILEQTIEEWRGDFEQIDDILIIGRKF